MGKKVDLGDFECVMLVGTRQAGINISQTVDLLGISYTIISKVYREWENIQGATILWRKMFWWCQRSEETGQNVCELVWSNSTVSQLNRQHNQDIWKIISDYTTPQPQFLLQHSDGRVRIRQRSRLVWTFQAFAGHTIMSLGTSWASFK